MWQLNSTSDSRLDPGLGRKQLIKLNIKPADKIIIFLFIDVLSFQII